MSRLISQTLKTISISLSPNTEKDDVWLAFKLIFKPWRWKKGRTVVELESQFKSYLGIKHAFAFNSGRSALMAILASLGLKPADEVLVQAYTCNAAVNPIRWAGLNLNYVDCDENDFNIDVEDLRRKVSSKTKAIMVQHTFGLPANMDKVLEIVQQNSLILIEDCAHALGAEYRGKKVGSFGKAAFFSLGRDKVISSVYGGIAVTNDDSSAEGMKKFQDGIKYPSSCWILQQLFHPVLMNWAIIPTYSFFGKYFLVLFQHLGIMSKAVHKKEKRGEKPPYFPRKMPNALAILALNQLKKLNRFNDHRREIAEFYLKNLKGTSYYLPSIFPERKNIFLRFTLNNERAHEIIRKAWRKNILIGDWYTTPIAPIDTKPEKIGYQSGSCPKAERLAKTTLNLPTHINISTDTAKKIVDFLIK